MNLPAAQFGVQLLICSTPVANAAPEPQLTQCSWGSSAAFATGIEQINNCTPNCAAGKFISYPVLVDLWRPEPLPGHPGVLHFSRVTRVYTANRPPLYFCHGTRICYPQTSTFDLWS